MNQANVDVVLILLSGDWLTCYAVSYFVLQSNGVRYIRTLEGCSLKQLHGEMAERSIASDCKSDASRLHRFKSYSPQIENFTRHGLLA